MQHDFILLDRSESMGRRGLWAEALASVNVYVAKLAEEQVDTGVTLVTFDRYQGELTFDVIRDRITPPTWRPVSILDADPRGSTPLNDAAFRLVHLADGGGYDKVAVIIMTDGEENTSREHPNPRGQQEVRALLDERRAKGWQVIFLGADFDNRAQAAGYGAVAESTLDAIPQAALSGAMRAAGASRAEHSRTGKSMGFSEEAKRGLREST